MVCIREDKNERLHESDMVKWMKTRKVKHYNKQYLMSKDEYKNVHELNEALQQKFLKKRNSTAVQLFDILNGLKLTSHTRNKSLVDRSDLRRRSINVSVNNRVSIFNEG
jgi:hypothetical protein